MSTEFLLERVESRIDDVAFDTKRIADALPEERTVVAALVMSQMLHDTYSGVDPRRKSPTHVVDLSVQYADALLKRLQAPRTTPEPTRDPRLTEYHDAVQQLCECAEVMADEMADENLVEDRAAILRVRIKAVIDAGKALS